MLVRCDDTSHPADDQSATSRLFGEGRESAIAGGVARGWTVDETTGEVLCPAHRQTGDTARERLRDIARQRTAAFARGARAKDAVVQELGALGALEAVSCLPDDVDFEASHLGRLPGGPRSVVIHPTTGDLRAGRLFVLRVRRRSDRIEPPGVWTAPYGSGERTIVTYNERPSANASAHATRSWECSLRKPLVEAVSRVGGVAAAAQLDDWAFEYHVEDPDVFSAVFNGDDDLSPWWAEPGADPTAVQLFLRRVASLYADAVVAATESGAQRRRFPRASFSA